MQGHGFRMTFPVDSTYRLYKKWCAVGAATAVGTPDFRVVRFHRAARTALSKLEQWSMGMVGSLGTIGYFDSVTSLFPMPYFSSTPPASILLFFNNIR
jgi:hypothetical protein